MKRNNEDENIKNEELKSYETLDCGNTGAVIRKIVTISGHEVLKTEYYCSLCGVKIRFEELKK